MCVCVYVSVYLCSLCVMCVTLGMYEHIYICDYGPEVKGEPYVLVFNLYLI